MNLENKTSPAPLGALDEAGADLLDEDLPDNPNAIIVDVVCQSASWGASEMAAAQQAAARAIAFGVRQKGAALGGELSCALVFADDAFVQNLNHKFRSINRPTNVLAFPAGDKNLLGDVVIGRETLYAEAADKKISPAAHAAHLAAHGALHLLGFTHAAADDAALMEALEIKILQSLGINNPYAEEKTDAK